MWVQHVDDTVALLALLVALAVAGVTAWLVPRRRSGRPPRAYSEAERTAYDRYLPGYALFAVAALLVGALHGLLKNLPGAFGYLVSGDHGGHMARDMTNTHVLVVGVGTVLLSGLTWYLLPRVGNRPLFSNLLANASFWLTAIGVTGFYLALLTLGLVEARMTHGGMPYAQAKAALGSWHSVPMRLTATFLGLGYWTYTFNALATVFAALGRARRSAQGHLLKFFAVGVAALFIGAVQGVLQVLPANEAWIQGAGDAGRFIDPISHAHINLVTGALMLTAAAFLFVGPSLGLRAVPRAWADRLFWLLFGGSYAFYVVTLTLGVAEGGMVWRGVAFPDVVARLGWRHTLPLVSSGVAMTVGVWTFLGLVLWSSARASFGLRWILRGVCGALFLGTMQGPLQAIPSLRLWYGAARDLGEFVTDAHAQLNILGGLTPLVVLLGLVLLPGLDRRRLRGALGLLLGGALLDYAGLLYVGVQASLLVNRAVVTLPPASAANLHAIDPRLLGAVAPPAIALQVSAFLLYGLGALRVARLVWPVTRPYRHMMVREARAWPERVAGPLPPALRRLPPTMPVGFEALAAFAGFPGLGWLMAGIPVVGLPLAATGPAVAWALLPLLFSPFGHYLLKPYGVTVYIVYLPGTAVLSAGALLVVLLRQRARGRPPRGGRRLPPGVRVRRRLIAAGGSVAALALLSTGLVPLFGGVVGARASYTALASIPEASRGVFVRSDGAFVRPYPWYQPRGSFPPDSLMVPRIERFVSQDRRTGEAADYRLVRLQDAHIVPLTEVARTRVGELERLELEPAEPLEAGRYLLRADQTSNMYGGTLEYYLDLDPSAPALVPPPAEPPRGAPADAPSDRPERAVVSLLAHLVTALVGIVLTWSVAADLLRKPAAQRLWWAVGIGLFALASTLELVQAGHGWTGASYRAWYAAGALGAAACLGQGTAWLLFPRRLARLTSWALVFYLGAVVALAWTAPIALAHLGPGDALSGRAFASPAVAGFATPRAHTIVLNSYGAILLVAGALASAWRFRRVPAMRGRVWGTMWIATGGLAMGAVGGANRLGFSGAQSLGELLALSAIFLGFRLAQGRTRPAAPASAPRPAVTASD